MIAYRATVGNLRPRSDRFHKVEFLHRTRLRSGDICSRLSRRVPRKPALRSVRSPFGGFDRVVEFRSGLGRNRMLKSDLTLNTDVPRGSSCQRKQASARILQHGSPWLCRFATRRCANLSTLENVAFDFQPQIPPGEIVNLREIQIMRSTTVALQCNQVFS